LGKLEYRQKKGNISGRERISTEQGLYLQKKGNIDRRERISAEQMLYPRKKRIIDRWTVLNTFFVFSVIIYAEMKQNDWRNESDE